eukprot:CAMPEP_0185618294 /NCGR_PEP_ID=MMETSP0436-20130131/46521_1 /TAXON_ID=626734 ORGANISM="Favella taraikaensis, Strain Fe Narragansett Bay" /NCGR_SAMPLE_ID=MMETSP0436 /ASSEMBLY_ACC=CAM_ASM_000390 /LENGTH=53 /DNA_ID=CAMNT_0028256763 /DNA_START=640 /DNA_END=801 /DNA_ORIENTATION=-
MVDDHQAVDKTASANSYLTKMGTVQQAPAEMAQVNDLVAMLECQAYALEDIMK